MFFLSIYMFFLSKSVLNLYFPMPTDSFGKYKNEVG